MYTITETPVYKDENGGACPFEIVEPKNEGNWHPVTSSIRSGYRGWIVMTLWRKSPID